MRKILTTAAVLAILLIPAVAVFASAPASPALTGDRKPICHSGGERNWTEISPDNDGYRGHFNDQGQLHGADFFVDDDHPCPPEEPTATPVPISVDNTCRGWRVRRGDDVLDRGEWTLPFELEQATSQYVDFVINEPRECLQVEPTATPEPITLENSCAGWRLKQGGQTIDGGTWDDPYSLEIAASSYVDYVIREPEECLKQRGDPTLRIGGRCTEDGDSQEIGYVFDDGDFDGARLIITREDGVEVANEGEGSGFFPARAAVYGWKIMWFDGEQRVQLDAGRFEVEKCDLDPTPTPTPKPKDDDDDDPDEHPSTGADPNTIMPLITALTGFGLAGIGGTILYTRKRASR